MRVEKSTRATPQIGDRFYGHEMSAMQHCRLRAEGDAPIPERLSLAPLDILVSGHIGYLARHFALPADPTAAS
jgi:hypothetical protein